MSASLILTGGVAEEPADKAGATVLAARALTEGTEQHDAIALVEATERLGASLHADAGWDAVSVGVDVPAARLAPALELAAEVLLQPTFPEAEVDRLRDERLNDLLQARADPRRRVDEAFVGTIYARESPYHRPSGGTRETVEGLTPDDLRRAFGRSLDPARATLIIGGDLGDQDCVALAERLFGGWSGNAASQAAAAPVVDTGSSVGRVIRVVHRPGSVQTEIRIGHRGLPRRIDDFHAVSVMAAILGGLFNSRLNMKLREEKGYTYGAGAGFDMRRGAGPFSARAAVNTEVTVPAILDTLAELTRMRDTTVADSELAAARDFLIGVFPLRFETAGAVVGSIGSLAVHGLGVEELIGYRANDRGGRHARPSRRLPGHISTSTTRRSCWSATWTRSAPTSRRRVSGSWSSNVTRPPVPVTATEDEEAAPGPVDKTDEEGPTAGAEEPELPGSAEE